NPAAEHFYGWSREQLLQMKIQDINTQTPEEVNEELALARAQQRNYFEFRHRRADGSCADVEVFSGPLRYRDNDYLYIIHDISARKKAELALTVNLQQQQQEQAAWIEASERARLATLNLTEDAVEARKKAEQGSVNLEWERQRLANVIWGTGVGTWEWNVQTGEIHVNDQWARFIGYTLEELEPLSIETWQRLAHPEDLEHSDQLFEQHFRGEVEFYDNEVRMRHKAGHWVWVLDRGRLVDRTADGKPRWVAGTHLEITARKEAESLAKSLHRRTGAQLLLPEARNNLSEKGFMQYAQELAEDLTNSRISFIHFVNDDEQTIELVTWSRRTIEHYCTVVHDTHYPVSEAGVWADALRQRQPVVINDYAGYPGKRGLPDGHAQLDRMISVPVFEDGKVVMLTGVGNKDSDYTALDVETVQLLSNDIWRLVQRQRSLDSLRKLALAVEQSPESIVITNAEAEIEYVNAAFTRVTGYTPSEVAGQNPRVLQSGRTPPGNYDTLWATLARGETWKGEFYNRKKSGEEYTEYAFVTPLRQADGTVTHYVAIKEDITEKKRLARELDNHRHHLEELVDERTHQLEEARRHAEAANQAKSTFLANMS
ncbi:MAG: PAS domain S-box protein, partial [Haliea sp.]